MELDKAIKSRHSVRKFNSKKPDWRDIIEAIDAARYAPMAGRNYTVKFILIDNPESIKKIKEACQQDFVAKAQYVVVICSKPSITINAYGERGKNYARQQSGAAIQNFFLKITELGLATCWVGHFVEGQVKSALKIPDDINVEAIFPVGFEYEKKRTRKAPTDLDNILYFNEWKQKRMKKIKKITV